MESKGKIVNITFDEYGNPLAIIALSKECRAELHDFIGTELDVKISKHRKKRSKNANDYMWVLCSKIAAAVGISKDEVYTDAIHHAGIYKDFHDLNPEAEKTFKVMWNTYGKGWVAERVDFEPDGEHIHMRGYYGSSVYNSKQMYILINFLKNEADNLGIETMTPNEILNMTSLWKGAKINA